MPRLQLNMVFMAGLCAAGALIPVGAHARVQDASADGSQSQDAGSEPATDDQTAGNDLPSPSPPALQSQSLDDLIPQSAVGNAAEWAGDGVANPAPVIPLVRPLSPLSPPATAQLDTDGGGEVLDVLIDPTLAASLDEFELPQTSELGPDPEVLALERIDAPDLIELPPLDLVRISSEMTLGFPEGDGAGGEALFPERNEFLNRFDALSTVEALESGEDTVPQLAARARADEGLLVQMLRVYGYYDGEVVRQLSGGRRDGEAITDKVDTDPQVRFDILPGERYEFGEIALGDLVIAPDYEDLRNAFAIQSGDPLYSDKIVEEEVNLRTALGEMGYPFALIDPPELIIDTERKTGDLDLFVDPGGKYVVAGIVSEDEDFLTGRHLGRISRLKDGETYQASLQADLRRAILATGLVTSATISPREITPPDENGPGEVVLDVGFERAPLRTIAGAVGYGTEDGFKIEASWEHRNLFPPEGSLRLRGILGTREQLGSVTYQKKNFLARDQVLTIDAYASDIVTEAVDARTLAVRGTFEKVSNLLFQKPFSWQVGAEALYTDERNRVIGGVERPRQTYQIFGLFGSATIDSSNDLLDPTEGFRLTGFVAPEVSRSLSTETFYLRSQVDASYYQSVGSTVLAGRTRLATIQGARVSQIAPSRRLYAGGGSSVRGYGFQGVGPRNDFGEATGGGSLVELSLEARIQTGFLDGAVEVVPFIDAGTVALGSTPDFRFIQYGAGVGIRYKTSFGPIRVDVGLPINPTEFDAPVVVYVGLGQAF